MEEYRERVGEKDEQTRRSRRRRGRIEQSEQAGPMLLRSEEERPDSASESVESKGNERDKTERTREREQRNCGKKKRAARRWWRRRQRRPQFKRRVKRERELREMELGAPRGHILFPFEAPDKSNAAECIIR